MNNRLWPCLLLPLLLLSCVQSSGRKVRTTYDGTRPPVTIAVLPAEFAEKESPEGPLSDDDEFVLDVTRSTIHNLLAGRGYTVSRVPFVDRKLRELEPGGDWQALSPQRLCMALGVDALVYVRVDNWQMVRAAAIENSLVNGEVSITDRNGKSLGSWSAEESRKKVSIPTSWQSLIGTLLESYFGDPARKQFRFVAYAWGDKITQAIPEAPMDLTPPSIARIDTNVDRMAFGIGQTVTVTMQAREGLACNFSIGPDITVPMHMTGPGTYRGEYTVPEGPPLEANSLLVQVVGENGVERYWYEEGPIRLIGVRPSAPRNVRSSTSADGIRIRWNPQATDRAVGFMVERNDRPAGQYADVALINAAEYEDKAVEQGKTYYYRIRTIDEAGNRSAAPAPLSVSMPYRSPRPITGETSGTLLPGDYLVKEDLIVPSGATLELQPGTRLEFSPDAGLVVHGDIVAKGSKAAPVVLGAIRDRWQGVRLAATASATLRNTNIEKAENALLVNGTLSMTGGGVTGPGKTGVTLASSTVAELKGVVVSGWEKGVLFASGSAGIRQCTLRDNALALEFKAGDLDLTDSHFAKNETNILADEPFNVERNYLGPLDEPFRTRGSVNVKSLYDSPPPLGRLHIFEESSPLTPGEIDELFARSSEKGYAALGESKFGQAHQYFAQALRYKKDADVYAALIITKHRLGETEEAEALMGKALEAFPYNLELHELCIRLLIGWGRYQDAQEVVQKALRMQPEAQQLKYYKDITEFKQGR